MHQLLKDEQADYRTMVGDPGLEWLNLCYKSARRPLAEYRWLSFKSKLFIALRNLLVVTMLFGILYPLVMAITSNGLTRTWMLLIVVTFLATSSLLVVWWGELITVWLNAKWETISFTYHVREVARMCLGIESDKVDIRWLRANGEEIKRHLIPRHVCEACEKYLMDKIEAVLEIEDHENKYIYYRAKEKVREDFEIIQHFSIWGSYDLKHYYDVVKSTLKTEDKSGTKIVVG